MIIRNNKTNNNERNSKMKTTIKLITMTTLLIGSLTAQYNWDWNNTTTFNPSPAENGDYKCIDNDRDGRVEPVYVKGYYRTDGTYVRSHYRAKPKRWIY